MYVVVVDIRIAEGAREAFMGHLHRQAERSQTREAGCHRFDICISEDDPSQVLLYEVYEDRGAFDAHLKTDHFAEFDAVVQPLMASKSARSFLRE